MTHPRDADDVLVLDQYLDSLLAAPSGTTAADAPGLDPAVRASALRLRRDLVRIHPSFRFEERLAARLASAGAARRLVAGGEGAVIPFRARRTSASTEQEDALLAAIEAGTFDPAGDQRLPPASVPVLIGGALTSALSLAGVVWVAWRAGRSRGPGASMRRAARAAHRRGRRDRFGPAIPRRFNLS